MSEAPADRPEPSGAASGVPADRPEPSGMVSKGSDSILELLTKRDILVCCGTGGVGKTTTAAALALEGARQGRSSCVVTIDPARRLADSLGVAQLSNSPHEIQGDWPGKLWAMMLDPKRTFDELVAQYASDAEQAERILSNRIYRSLSEALSGTHEYMAMEKLFELHNDRRFDLVVVDTPPTRNALDFLDAPGRLVRFLENRLFRLLLMPTRAYLRAVSIATRAFLRTVSKVVGVEMVQDAVAFFQAFEGMEEGFRARAESVSKLLVESGTAFVLVASPRRDSVEEAEYFAGKLKDANIEVEALVMNRLHPSFDDHEATKVDSKSAARPEKRGARRSSSGPKPSNRLSPEQAREALAVLRQNRDELNAVVERESNSYEGLLDFLGDVAVARVPFLAGDVHDLEGLEVVASYLVGPG